LTIVVLLALSPGGWGDEVPLRSPPEVVKDGARLTISFAVSARTDVEVSILDARGMVVRHLAAGVLGAKIPPPVPLRPGLEQKLTWDGKDDLGKKAQAGPFRVRVRAGSGVRFGRFLGDDPYTFGQIN